MALVGQTVTLKWDTNRQVEKLNFRLKWDLRNLIATPSTVILKWNTIGLISPKTCTLKWDLDRVIPIGGHHRIYTMPVVNRIFEIDNETHI